MYLRVLIEASMSYSFYCCCYRRAPRGRYSCIAQGASPGLIIGIHLLSPFRGGTSARVLGVVVMLYCIYPLGHLRAWVSAAPTDLNPLLSAFPQGFISGFALISPWALQECRPFRALCRIGCVSPGFHIGLCPHFTLGFAGVSPLQGSLSDWAFAVLCCGIVFVKCVLGCVNELLRSVVFLYLFDCGCIVCGIGGIDCCGRAMSPKGAILLYSPGRKPWVNHCNTFIEPL